MKKGSLKRGLGLFSVLFAVICLMLVTLSLADSVPIIGPANWTNSSNTTLTLEFNITWDSGDVLNNFSIFFGQDGTWGRNTTNTTSTSNNTFTNIALSGVNEGVYNWSVEMVVDGVATLNDTNYTIVVDTTVAISSG